MRLLAWLAPGLDVLEPLRDAVVLRGGWASWEKIELDRLAVVV